jgi:hypothetical protein
MLRIIGGCVVRDGSLRSLLRICAVSFDGLI